MATFLFSSYTALGPDLRICVQCFLPALPPSPFSGAFLRGDDFRGIFSFPEPLGHGFSQDRRWPGFRQRPFFPDVSFFLTGSPRLAEVPRPPFISFFVLQSYFLFWPGVRFMQVYNGGSFRSSTSPPPFSECGLIVFH